MYSFHVHFLTKHIISLYINYYYIYGQYAFRLRTDQIRSVNVPFLWFGFQNLTEKNLEN